MGNKQSLQQTINDDKTQLPYMIDEIATKYILTQDFKDMTQLRSKEYCNKLMILTSDIIRKRLRDSEITYLHDRIKNGDTITKDVVYGKKGNFSHMDVEDSLEKQKMCNEISKFYVKILHVFSAISATVNPVYEYISSRGEHESVPLMKKNMIPEYAKENVNKKNISLCSRRIKSLMSKIIDDTKGVIRVDPKVCDANKKDDGEHMTLQDEPGVPELKHLYYDIFNYDSGSFTSMSPESKHQFKKDLATFYTTFTGNETMPDNIESFSDIKLRDFSKDSNCQPGGLFTKGYDGLSDDTLFSTYGSQLQKMTKDANDNRNKLVGILRHMFLSVTDASNNIKTVTIHPDLDEAKLQKIVVETRNLITRLYIGCENDYLALLRTFETIVESQYKNVTQQKIKSLEEMKYDILTKPSV